MSQDLFPQLSDECDAEEPGVTEVESLCLQCGENGTTKLLLTSIPFYKQVVVMSFHCPHCGWQNNELQPAQTIDQKGVRFVVRCQQPKDLSRQIVKTEWAEIQIPEIEFEVKKQAGLITTIEGIIERAIEGLKETQLQLKGKDPKSIEKISEFILKLIELKSGNKEFTFILDDMSGNSFVENLCIPNQDPAIDCKRYTRDDEQNKILGIYEPEEPAEELPKDEVLQFGTNCPNCNAHCFTNFKLTKIPHFKEIILIATNCDACGHKTNEIKSGAGVEATGVRIKIKIKDEKDLKLEVVKSDTCDVKIPELDLEINSSGSGRYTTIEGLGLNIIDELQRSNPFIDGDAASSEIRGKLKLLSEKLKNLIGCTIILDDACGNSFIENADECERYKRTWQQNEDLGLNDIKTENYQS